jgi:hypothetical protein
MICTTPAKHVLGAKALKAHITQPCITLALPQHSLLTSQLQLIGNAKLQ